MSMLFFFFFFKQKTAYEMRISDWSSDVCSSDLLGMLGDEVDRHIGVKPGEVGLEFPETRTFAELVRLFGEEAFLVGNEHPRPQPPEGRETMVETIRRRPGRLGNVAPAAKVPFAHIAGVIARALHMPRDVWHPRTATMGPRK